MSSSILIYLLGGFRLIRDGALVETVHTSRLQALLARLVLHAGVPQSRQSLAFSFWPDSTDAQARTNLRQLLHHLRHALPESDRLITTGTQTITWNADAACRLDVHVFEGAADRAEEAAVPDDRQRAYEEAVNAYEGDLLPDCYDAWIEPERERLRQRYLSVLERIVDHLDLNRAYADALHYGRRLLREAPLQETTYRQLMRLHALRCDRASALRMYHECTTVLERELSVRPSPETQAVYEQLLRGDASASSDSSMSLVGDVPLVGRHEEWREVRAAWERARGGTAVFAAILGEAGIGKTRLAEELLAWVQRQGGTTARARCYDAEGRLAFGPVAEWLREPAFDAGIRDADPVWQMELSRILPERVDLRAADPRPPPMVERGHRQRLFEALARVVHGVRPPLLLVIDDLQWCDQDTLEWLHFLFRFQPQTQLLVVGTVRVEEMGDNHSIRRLLLDLRRADRLTEIELGALSAPETALLAEHVTGTGLDTDRARTLYEKTEGSPLFVVEGLRAGWFAGEQGPPSTVSPSPLPSSVHAILEARMSQLSAGARNLAHLASAFKRSFTFEMLAAANGEEEGALVQALDELWQRRMIRETGTAAYDFSHDKLREVAYYEVSPVRRQALHRCVAKALLAVCGDTDAVSGALADHFEQAGHVDRAVSYYRRAAEAAQRVHASEETIRLTRRALALIPRLPDGPDRDRREFSLLVLLGPALVTTRGWADPEVGRVYEQARLLGTEALDRSELVPVLWGLRTHHVVRAELVPVRERGEELLAIAEQEGDDLLRSASHLAVGIALFHLGHLTEARSHLANSLDAGTDVRVPKTFPFGPDLGVFAWCYLSHTLWLLGYPDQALVAIKEAELEAETLDHPFSRALTLDYAAMLYQFRREPEAARAAAELAFTLCEKHGYAYYRAWSNIVQGGTRPQEDGNEARAQMRAGIDELQNTGAKLRLPYYLSLVAKTHPREDVEARRADLQQALDLVEATGEQWIEAELHRSRGELLRDENPDEAETCFRTALQIATRQHARPFMLRAALSLCRLQGGADEGKREGSTQAFLDARELLRETVNAFSEGFDTVDLVEAQALLSQLK